MPPSQTRVHLEYGASSNPTRRTKLVVTTAVAKVILRTSRTRWRPVSAWLRSSLRNDEGSGSCVDESDTIRCRSSGSLGPADGSASLRRRCAADTGIQAMYARDESKAIPTAMWGSRASATGTCHRGLDSGGAASTSMSQASAGGGAPFGSRLLRIRVHACTGPTARSVALRGGMHRSDAHLVNPRCLQYVQSCQCVE